MNLRFADQSVRVRVSTEEFSQLLAGKTLGLEVSLPHGHVFRAKVSHGHAWQFENDPTGFWFNVPQSELDVLAHALPRKEGISHAFATHSGELQVDLEVDVKSSGGQAAM